MTAAEHLYRRGDGAVLGAVDLAQCLPIHPTELTEWLWPISLVEDWLLHASDDALAELAHFLGTAACGPTPAQVTEHLGRTALALHRLIAVTGNNT